MILHEFQAKELFTQYKIPIPKGKVIDSNTKITELFSSNHRWVAKAQIHAGGRGKAGGVLVSDNPNKILDFCNQLLGDRLATNQTSVRGLPVYHILIEEASTIIQECYLAFTINRQLNQITIVASEHGGIDIEQVAHTHSDEILQLGIHPVMGLMSYQCRQIGFALKLNPDQHKQLKHIMEQIYQLFIDHDASLVEINPLAITDQGTLVALDAKIVLDDNASFRHPYWDTLRDTTQEDQREVKARSYGLNYVALEGDIACMVNGAGLAMATMDLIKLHGGNPANFLDVGGTATAERVAEAFKLILADGTVKSILINIFGGIVRCDLIAEGIIQAVKEVNLQLPVVVRLAGTNADQGRNLLAKSGLNLISANDLTDAAHKAVLAAQP
ncbi:ADP-forming succinate--CoA ligase subunit beta [Candidatus Nitrosacidococcus sp. I8]|uniref:ADP-forming succinate--CoA ligase subunit beta n=1 Tax=Candidatus Nitrosacidococcus sp. I8 TaxID=2942908 RepID=UPI0022276C9D|nr:ADP-forming succinate--CoA ligase subunit beta [Candidatus Nitrosacidococcus sp. I8]CAH9019409.1 Succinate--CoA ligase [ADP-forming] subunit beta [Candidatus Nitrosacidococcus sp. I8]